MQSNLQSIKERIAKLLRLQNSSNENEAANAVLFVEKLCREYGLSPKEVADFDEDERQPVGAQEIRTSTAPGDRALWNSVALYFDVKLVYSTGEIHLFGTEASRVQVELYVEYLFAERAKLLEAARILARYRGENLRGFSANFTKAFAYTIGRRLKELKAQQHSEGIPASDSQNHVPGIVLVRNSATQLRRAEGAARLKFPRLRTSRTSHNPRSSGYRAGASAGNSVSLNRQVNAGTHSRRLAGAC